MADVKVRVVEEVENAGKIAEAAGDLDKLDQETKKASDSGKEYGKSLNDMVKQLTGFNLAQLSAGAVLVGAIKTVGDAVRETTDYANTVRKLSLTLSLGTEETSRIIQVFDDYGVSADRVKVALDMMSKNGIAPSIDSLAKLSDKVLAMQDPTERAAALSKIFGRNWADVSEVLFQGGDAIRKQSAAISSNLILTEKEVAASRQYEIATDNLNDAVTGLKTRIGNQLIPVLTTLANALNDCLTAQDDVTSSTKEVYNSYEDYKSAVDAALKENGMFIDSQGRLATHNGVLQKSFNYLTKEEWDAIAAGNAMTDSFKREAMHAGATAGEIGDLTDATEEVADAFHFGNVEASFLNRTMAVAADDTKEMAEAFGLATGEAEDMGEGISTAKRLLDEYTASTEEWKTALLDAGLDGTLQDAWDAYQKAVEAADGSEKDALETFKQTTAEIIYQRLAMGLDADQALILAEKMGLVSQKDIDVMNALKDLKAALDPSSMGLYGDAAAIFASELAAGASAAQALKKALDFINGKTFTTTVIIEWKGEKPPFKEGGANFGPPIKEEQFGFQGWVGNRTAFMAGEAGEPEFVSVIPRSKMQQTTNNWNLTINEAGQRGNVLSDFALLQSLAQGA